MNRLLLNSMGIREEERVKSILMFATIFLIIASLLIVKPVRNSLFLANVGIASRVLVIASY